MKSLPILEAVCMGCLFALAFVPLWSLTGGHSVPPPSDHAEGRDSFMVRTLVGMRFAAAPRAVQVLAPDGRVLVVLEADGNQTRFDAEVEMPVDAAGYVDLDFEVEWPENAGETAFEVVVEPAAHPRISRTFWGDGVWSGEWSFALQ